MLGRKLREFLPREHRAAIRSRYRHCYFVKSPVFPFNKFPGVDPVLGPEMRSTGEVMGVADNFGEAFAKAQLAPDRCCRRRARSSSASTITTSRQSSTSRASFVDLGFKLVATHGTAQMLENCGPAG